MGSFLSRRNGGVEEVDISASHAYRYPPKSGCYFGSHFIMGGEKFETTHPESYLFGENTDLNFLGNRPAPFPYPAPQAHEPTKTLKSLVNIRKDSIRFIKVINEEDGGGNEESREREEEEEGEKEGEDSHKYNIEFTFDSDVRVAITIYYFATEEISNGQAIYESRDATMNSETYHYKRGANQTFSQSTHILEPGKFPPEQWQYHPDKEVIPVVIQCVVEEEQYSGHSHASYATVEKSVDGGFVLKALKQKQMVDGLYYLLQEIYGIENKSPERQKLDDEFDDNGSECVICMCETRDTLILPCRHLCLCHFCADNLRYQANNCPICRAPFRALLQIRAMKKKITSTPTPPPSQQTDDDTAVSQEGVPSGFEAVPLIEALNGPQNQANNQPIMPPINPIFPPDDSTGNSPALKRKHRRSSAKANRQGRRAAREDKTAVISPRQAVLTTPTEVATEGATAVVAMTAVTTATDKPEELSVLPDTPHAEIDNTSVKLDMESGTTETVQSLSDEKNADFRECVETAENVEEIAERESVRNGDDTAIGDTVTVCMDDDLPSGDGATGCTDDDLLSDAAAVGCTDDENEDEEKTPLCGHVVEELHAPLTESRLQSAAESLDFHDSPLKPAADSSGSSYSSTSSSKGLLDGVPPAVAMNPRPEV